MKKTVYKKLNQIQKKLVCSAIKMLPTAYNPYSHFAVGAALLSSNNKIITGSNVENASYGLTICAERSALVRANAEGIRLIKKIAIVGQTAEKITGPCGACRQMIFEAAQISNQNIEIIMSDTKKGKVVIAKIEELLPLAFGPKNLKVNLKKYR
ncbi:MAG: cytidine deaminase [Candidatus Magasanikbacteria bacterium CG10_big_fil_rev_8_21_14_0_10_36_32]|uniref:Cytidine deaminase n=1 Tax=Candidatus Magasanikbacteria bacterium CG10_big_fil_rev_8_21_14_0_10_36_32 TaxID=1974646 RepID=A0A2M6W710_9BACT|nr:MAG: cytidine deaminase [Candidatus Magasanikbacteria bacterium CG10_big_fil_rev_8_21_14_0_10_36_32]